MANEVWAVMLIPGVSVICAHVLFTAARRVWLKRELKRLRSQRHA